MKQKFVKTKNFERFVAGISAVSARGAEEASLMLLTGPAALGKTLCASHWAVENNALFVKACATWTKRSGLEAIASSLKIDTRCRTQDLLSRIVARVAVQQIPLVIDEAEHTLHGEVPVLESIRDITDLTNTTAILIGMERVEQKIARHPQISSRISHVVTFEPLPLSDVAALCDELPDCRIGDDLVDKIHRDSHGRTRLIVNAIATTEQFAARNGLSCVNVADLAGHGVVYDWEDQRSQKAKAKRGR